MNAALIFSISGNHPPNGQKRKGTEWATSWWTYVGFTYHTLDFEEVSGMILSQEVLEPSLPLASLILFTIIRTA